MSDQTIIRNWLKALGVMSGARMGADEAQARLNAFVPNLVESFPDQKYFCQLSLRYVAERCKFFPTYGELVEHLNSWSWTKQPLKSLALTDDVTTLTDKDRIWLSYWVRRRAEGFSPLREPDGRLSRPDVQDWRRHTESLIRQHAPKAWATITDR